MRFAGRTIILTGAAGGLGSGIAAAFAAEGGNVAVVDLPGGRGAEVAAEIKLRSTQRARDVLHHRATGLCGRWLGHALSAAGQA